MLTIFLREIADHHPYVMGGRVLSRQAGFKAASPQSGADVIRAVLFSGVAVKMECHFTFKIEDGADFITA